MQARESGAPGAGLYVEEEPERAVGRARMPGRQFGAGLFWDFGIRPINAQFPLLMASWMMPR